VNLVANEQYEQQQLEHDGGDRYFNMTVFDLLCLNARRNDDQGGHEDFEPLVHEFWKVARIRRSDEMADRRDLKPCEY